ncbi:heterokaryon incompatibility protein-domain-containing protein [Chaetomium tenue]|uniref:Heterokaryon incompatibility protein-domain-containing protein n=1 Tax=Chaetomium tenue TaxID=1854479 RepID=A0ACB7P486_9PEZI|nr:heterokaryon incompatibility protein-domain-containing protein [Chaetomium globosum]
MRLLNTSTLRLESFFDPYVPRYAILSHTWEDEEVLFEDIRDAREPLPVHKKGFTKVQGSCRQARQDGFGYIWIDSCCIDKSSSAELSEAINSMFQWYHKSRRRYAYLVDINAPAGERSVSFRQSRWFTRGWTLQELIAPRDVRFYDHNWSFLGIRQTSGDNPGTLEDMADEISNATTIPVNLLRWYRSSPWHSDSDSDDSAVLDASHPPAPPTEEEVTSQLTKALRVFSVAQKMSWAAKRRTTRLEDEAYCLLGLFDVNMPMLYGEGDRAFFRLQQEILKVSDDQSILAFDHRSGYGGRGFPEEGITLLADSPKYFVDSQFERPPLYPPSWPGEPSIETELLLSSRFLEIGLCLCPLMSDDGLDAEYLGILRCVYRDDFMSHPAIPLQAVDRNKMIFQRIRGRDLRKISPLDLDSQHEINGKPIR